MLYEVSCTRDDHQRSPGSARAGSGKCVDWIWFYLWSSQRWKLKAEQQTGTTGDACTHTLSSEASAAAEKHTSLLCDSVTASLSFHSPVPTLNNAQQRRGLQLIHAPGCWTRAARIRVSVPVASWQICAFHVTLAAWAAAGQCISESLIHTCIVSKIFIGVAPNHTNCHLVSVMANMDNKWVRGKRVKTFSLFFSVFYFSQSYSWSHFSLCFS